MFWCHPSQRLHNSWSYTMANLRLGIALGGVLLTLFVPLHLLAVIQYAGQSSIPSFDYNFNQWKSRASTATDDGLFLVGAGKADVTGYSSPLLPCRDFIALVTET